MNEALFNGVCTALVTPFTEKGINYGTLERILQRQLDAKIPAIVLAGTTGESPTLTDSEKLALFRFSKSFVGNRCKIIAGTGSNCTLHAKKLSRAAQETGVDGLLVVSPYYNKATEAGLIAHYRQIAESVEIPVIIYNVPGRTGLDIPVAVYKALSQISNIAGVKEASTCITKALKIRAECPESFALWSGNDEQTVPVMALGGKGIISVVSNIFPEEMMKMTTSVQNRDLRTATEIQCRLLPLIEALFQEVNPIPVKAAMTYIGLDCGGCRLPLCAPSEETVRVLRNLLGS